MIQLLTRSDQWILAGLLGLLTLGCSVLRAEAPNSPLAPADAIQTLHVAPELVVELAASEPQVQDPVAICWDA